MRPFWRRPIWLLGHVIAVVAVVAFLRAGLWQIDRLHEKQERNRIAQMRSDGPAIALADVEPSEAQYQRVRVTGHLDESGQVLIRNRAFAGVNGFHVVTPLVLDDSSAVLVNRGWIGVDDEPPHPPRGEVTIEGLLLLTQERRIGPRDPPTRRLDVLNRIDVRRVQQQLDLRLYPLFVQQTAPATPEGGLPILVEPPPRDEGPHRSYATQWFLFAAVVTVGYPLLLRKHLISSRSGPYQGPDRDEIGLVRGG